MATRAVQEAIYETSCDRCGKVAGPWPDYADWWKVDPRQNNSAPERPAWDLCRDCFFVIRAQIEDGAQDQPTGRFVDEPEDAPGSILPRQQNAIHAKCKGMGRDERLATIGDIVGRQVASSNELSYTEAARVLEKLT